ncbi:BQ5605_C003g02106 [Microbotryum silenes-dioicae]|uniref:BQ5605_C003g02106 protein n=1 Tax=Microbotryum silenes-dioicae TaxID=796604 RepID=A0A2X0NY18_9BASI|nr:BQ5605_C003g02106 [Microbotryum silenes-dioicae]
MTTMQPILALRHVYEPAVQLCRTDGVVSAMANSTLGSPHHHLLRKGECAGLESRSNPSSPTFSQGKVQLPPPPQPNLEYRQLLEGSDSEAKAFRENARSYNNAFSFTSLAAHWDQTQVGTLGPPVFRVFSRLYHRLGALIPTVTQRPAFAQTWLIDPAEATDTRLGPDGADSRMQRSTLTKVESILRTGNRFVREFASAKAHAGWDTAKEWILRLCLPPGRDRRTHNLPTSSTEMAMLICDSDTNTGDRGRQDLILQVHGDRCPEGRPKYQVMASTPTFLVVGSNKLGHSLPKDRDEEEGDAENGDGKLSRSQLLAYDLHKRDEYFSIPHCTQRGFLAFVMTDTPRSRPIDSTYLQLDQENLRLTTGQGIISLTSDQAGCSVILGSTFKNRPRENTQRYQDAMACVVKHGKPSLFITVTCNPEWPEIKAALGPNDQASNRPELIARAFESKLNRLCDDNVFGNKQRAGCL